MKDEPTLENLTNPKFGKPRKAQNALLQQLGKPHTTSFNFMINRGLELAVADLSPVEFELNNDRYLIQIDEASFSCPLVPASIVGVKSRRVYPKECRLNKGTYKGKFVITVKWAINGKWQTSFEKDLGDLPIMVKSNRCHLDPMTPKELVEHGEHEQEWGGYFLVKGNQRLIRMLQMTRRNFPIAIKRPGWKGRGSQFSESGITVRCVKEDETATTNVLHFLTDGTAKLMFSHRKTLYYTPLMLILKCLVDDCDKYIYEKLVRGYKDDSYYTDCIQNMLRALREEGFHNRQDCKNYLGRMFRVKFTECPSWWTDGQIADFIIKKCLLIHLDKLEDKFNMFVFMTQKLFVFVQDKCKAEGADAVMMHELLLGGHLYLQIVKEKMQGWLQILKSVILKLASNNSELTLTQNDMLNAAKRSGRLDIAMEKFLATGNLASPSGLGVMQENGLTIVAENINRMRYMSHFRAIHRGAFFQEMRTTEVRQLLPDAWGFVCPVHTPDGPPCGLLNHLTMNCCVTDAPDPQKVANIPLILTQLGMDPFNSIIDYDVSDSLIVLLDGKVLGYLPNNIAKKVVNQLRLYKIKGEKVPNTLEIVLVPLKTNKKVVAQFPGVYLFTGPTRMMRPLMNLATKEVELVGTFEQVYLDICVTPNEFYPDVTTHMELSKTALFSNLAQLIPMPDCNQSPRNMYQCQMGKQTMGTPCLNWNLQAETKLYRLQTPGSPLFRPVHYDNIDLDDFAMGTNAIVAVISYTGYDMEDAMIINKATDERGFAHGQIYKSDFVTLEQPTSYFCLDPEKPELREFLDTDGLPFVGRRMQSGEPLYCYYSVDESFYKVCSFHGSEECYVDSVRLCGNLDGVLNKTACITFRVPRNSCIGDKFASRAGQKGICSLKLPMEDMPFTETGLVPDIIFNPHGFPSRMTIAMMIEIMAGKSAAVHGLVHDATPFKFSEDDSVIDYFGRCLEMGGYNYHGTETMYSGIDGRELEARIFFGVVHYQRLRHMVSDKWQVRSTGPTDVLTRQPLKGRKRGGGVRFGEMERDALISHGAAFLLQDRLFHNSDKTTVNVCKVCGTLLGINLKHCLTCGKHGENVAKIQLPYIFKFFVTEMASVNIKVKIDFENFLTQ